jgi:diguanylate cyclase (GGDEF)-like protein
MKEFSAQHRPGHGSLIVDSRGTILGFDQAMEHLTGWPAIEVVGRSKDLGLAGSSSIGTIPLYDGRIPMEPRLGNFELTLHCRDGRSIDVEAMGRPLNGGADRMLVTVLQVLASTARNAAAAGGDRCDPLTGLPVREGFASRLAASFAAARARACPLSLILLDVDRLRSINDRLGHGAGDEVLCRIAGMLRVEIGNEEHLARLGDDDFAVLLLEGGRGKARQVAAGLRATVSRTRFFPHLEAGGGPQVTISLGTASFPADADTEHELADRAQEALDEARSMGRNRVWCYLRRPRIPVQVPVYFDGTDPLLLGYTRDLSPSGIFLQTTAGIEIGMRCALAFPLPGHEGKVHVVGRVVRTVRPLVSEDSHEVRIPGLGVEFERFGGISDRRAIDSFLHGREDQSLRPETGPLSV